MEAFLHEMAWIPSVEINARRLDVSCDDACGFVAPVGDRRVDVHVEAFPILFSFPRFASITAVRANIAWLTDACIRGLRRLHPVHVRNRSFPSPRFAFELSHTSFFVVGRVLSPWLPSSRSISRDGCWVDLLFSYAWCRTLLRRLCEDLRLHGCVCFVGWWALALSFVWCVGIFCFSSFSSHSSLSILERKKKKREKKRKKEWVGCEWRKGWLGGTSSSDLLRWTCR